MLGIESTFGPVSKDFRAWKRISKTRRRRISDIFEYTIDLKVLLTTPIKPLPEKSEINSIRVPDCPENPEENEKESETNYESNTFIHAQCARMTTCQLGGAAARSSPLSTVT